MEIVQILINALKLTLQIIYYICQSAYYNIFGLPEKSVIGEIVLITGAGHGIGKQLAIQYAHLGAIVVCFDINKQTNEETAKEIKATGRNAYAYQCDVTKREDVLAIAKKVKEEVGDVTILINNAGIMPCHNFLDHTADSIIKSVNVNVLAHFWMLQAFLPSMIEKNHGHVVALSSIAGLVGLPNLVPYSATKYAVLGLMEALEDELTMNSKGESLIKFTTIFPYMVNTGLCKKPKVNKILKKFVSLCTAEDTAKQIIKSQRQNIRKRSIPSFWLSFVSYMRLLPEKAIKCVNNFIDCGVEPD
ncbi:17-beta-hydroxysteroid dehydrogenase 13 [Solenopsis invicta]|uniref:17-beta-hydroxysteroid dehydrogenase 13 n=1 Tax=Solenopsis invicta TaxID=13686 RepID=UPI00059625A6|nr:17-beta-hydroxysteroid dehydrogenase 13 [Solenopsis invicta]